MKLFPSIACLVSLVGCAARAPVSEPTPSPERREPFELLLVTTSGDFSLRFGGLEKGRDCAWVVIRKNDPIAGLVEWEGLHGEGEVIGWFRKRAVHEVRSIKLNKRVPVDFDTKAILVSLAPARVNSYLWLKCPAVEDSNPSCPGPASVKETYRVNEVVVRLPDSKTPETLQQLAGPGPMADFLCPAHEKWRAAPSSWNQDMEGMPIYRERQVSLLLAFADQAWSSKNPKVRREGQEGYRKLLMRKRSAIVESNRERIEDRAKTVIED